MGRLIDHIKSNLYYFEATYNKSPERIFISTPLLKELEHELTLYHHRDGDYITCCGIIVEEFYSDKTEYYFAESGYEIKF
jgi:hypothetical protein